MNSNGLTMDEFRTFRELLVKANNSQIPQLVSLCSNEYKNRMMNTPTSVLMGDVDD